MYCTETKAVELLYDGAEARKPVSTNSTLPSLLKRKSPLSMCELKYRNKNSGKDVLYIAISKT
jgi:hypothetical protein